MKYLLYIFFLFSIFAHFMWDVTLVIGGGGIWSTDLLAITILVYFLFFYRDKKINISSTALRKRILVMIGILIIPIIIGIMNGNFIITVLRDARLIPMYSIPFVFLYAISSKIDLIKYLKFILLFGVINLLVFFIMYVFGLSFPTTLGIDIAYDMGGGEYIARYGVSSATFYYPLFLFILFNLHIENIYSHQSKTTVIVLILGYLFAIIFYAMRSFIIGVLGALILNVLLKIYKTKVIRLVIIGVIILIIAFVLVPSESYLDIPQIRRLVAVLRPEVAHKGVENNMLVRIEAIKLAITLTDNFFLGAGYGDPPTYADDVRINKARWWNHSAIAWSLYRLGFILATGFLIVFIKFIYETFQLSNKIKDGFIRNVLIGIGFYFISLFGLATGTNNFFRGDFFTMEIAICLGLVLAIENLTLKGEI